MNYSVETLTGTVHLQKIADRVAVWAAIVLGFSIPISTTGTGILVGLIAAALVMGGGFRHKLKLAVTHTTVLFGVALLAVTMLGILYGTASLYERADGFADYYELLLMPLLIPLFVDPKARRYGLVSMSIALTLILLVSYGLALGIIPTIWWPFGSPESAVPFRNRIDQGVLTAMGAFLFAVLACTVERPVWRAALFVLTMLAVANVLFINTGRTGYAVLAALVLFGATIVVRGRWQRLTAVAVIVVAGIAVYHFSPTLHQRIEETVGDLAMWQAGAVMGGSTTERLLLNHTALMAFLDHPVFGMGPGAFPALHAEIVAGTELPMHGSAHNEFLQAAVQSGIFGLGLLIAMIVAQWWEAGRLGDPVNRVLLRATVIAFTVSCLFNSFLLGHAGGHWWAWFTALLLASSHTPKDVQQVIGEDASRQGSSTSPSLSRYHRQSRSVERVTLRAAEVSR